MTNDELIKELSENDRDILIRMFKSRLNLTDKDLEGHNENDIIIEAHCGKVEGYSGFMATFDFDENGTLIGAGVWE